MRIAILGAGANGASIGADLTTAGLNVVLIDQWPEHVRAIRKRGLRVVMPTHSLAVEIPAYNLCEVATLRTRFDLVLLLMKAYDARWAAELIDPLLAPDGILVPVQNGMTTDDVASIVGTERTLGCVIEISSMLFEPGVVERHSPPDRSWFAIGSITSETHGREDDVAAVLRHAGAVETVADIRATKWMKLVSNCTTLVPSAILGLPLLAALEHPDARPLMLEAGREALNAGALHGYRPTPIFGLRSSDLDDSNTIAERLLQTLCTDFVLPATKTTVLVDWIKGRRSEVDQVNGLVVAAHREHGSTAPINERLVEVAHRIEGGLLEPDVRNVELLRSG